MEKRFRGLTQTEGKVSGYVALWDSPCFVDSIGKKESFKKDSLKLSKHGVTLHPQHNEAAVLASSKSGTLRISSNDKGLYFEAELPKEDKLTAELLKRGDLSGASGGFIVDKDSFENDCRSIQSAELHEISLVSKPAHSGTEVSFRKAQKPKRDWIDLL